MLQHLLDPAMTFLSAGSGSTRTLADISGDGTSNGSIMSIVNKVLLAVGVVIVGAFGLKMATTYMGKEADKTKSLMNEAKSFAIAEGLVAVAWLIANIAGNVFGGAAN